MGLETVSFSDDPSFGMRALASVGPRAQGSQNAWCATSDGHSGDRHTPLALQAFTTCRDRPDRRGTRTAENGTRTAHTATDTRKNQGLSQIAYLTISISNNLGQFFPVA